MKIILLITLIILSGCKQIDKLQRKSYDINMMKNPFFETEKIVENEKVLGEATTKILDKGKNRLNNIKIACEKVNGKEIKKGEIFSFNETTGKRNSKNGYKVAPVIVNGEKSEGIGGGVCQVSTTIYMSALGSGLEITEHHNHSEVVAYAPRGKDATVVYGTKDLKIRNNTDKSIFIYVWIEEEKVFSKIIQKSIDIQ